MGARCACGCGVAPGLMSLKGRGGCGCGAGHAAHTTVRAVPIARERGVWWPAAAATAGPTGPRADGPWPVGAGRGVLTAPALAGGVLYEAQENTPSIKPEY